MGGIKRKEDALGSTEGVKKQKVAETKSATPRTGAGKHEREQDDFGGFSDDGDNDEGGVDVGDVAEQKKQHSKSSKSGPQKPSSQPNGQFKLETSSAEAHAKQRALAKERKASKPNADAIQRSKKIWERLRRKSHVPLEERKKLTTELFDIINGRVRDFVFKHDSVRVVQCALKYATKTQRQQIVQELKGDVRDLVESKYGKFLVAKMVQDSDETIRDAIVPEFYGHVRKLINHPEASWIVDDIYRQIATKEQKGRMLREWYGAEFALFHRKPSDKTVNSTVGQDPTADLSQILEKNPEKRKPILQYLLQMINSLIQKKMTGFTMLHDAMLQYFLALTPGSEEHTEFLEILKGDIDKESEGGGGDLFRNLAFTRSGSRLVCLALAYGNAKDRKTILRCFKDTVETMAFDQFGKLVLVAGLEVPDDTKNTSRAILHELLGEGIEDEAQRFDRLHRVVTDLNARVPLLFPMAGMAKWLVTQEADRAVLNEMFEIRKSSSKKDPNIRNAELMDHMAKTLREFICTRAGDLAESSFGCQFLTETLLSVPSVRKNEALAAVAQLAAGDPLEDGHIAKNAAAGRMLKTLVMGGNFDFKTKSVLLVEPKLEFGKQLLEIIEGREVVWACSDSSFVIVALVESEDVPEDIKTQVLLILKKFKKEIEAVADGNGSVAEDHTAKKNKKGDEVKGNAGARKLLEKIA